MPKHISIIFLGMFRDLIDGGSDEGSPQVRNEEEGEKEPILDLIDGRDEGSPQVGRPCHIIHIHIQYSVYW